MNICKNDQIFMFCEIAKQQLDQNCHHFLVFYVKLDAVVMLCFVSMVTVAVFEDNADLRARLATKALPTREFIEVDIGDGYSK